MRRVATMPTPILTSKTTAPTIQSPTSSCCHDKASPVRGGADWSTPGPVEVATTTAERASPDIAGASGGADAPADTEVRTSTVSTSCITTGTGRPVGHSAGIGVWERRSATATSAERANSKNGFGTGRLTAGT